MYQVTVTDAATAEVLATPVLTADRHMDAIRAARHMVDDGRAVLVEVSVRR